jgi:cytochrome P450
LPLINCTILILDFKHCIKKIKEIINSRGYFPATKHTTIFHDLLNNDSLPKEDKTVHRLNQEAQLLLSAGTVTTATSISSAFVYLFLDPKRMQVLMEELEDAIPDITKPVREAEVEKLPYIVGYLPSLLTQELTRFRPQLSKRLSVSCQVFLTVCRARLQQRHCSLETGQFLRK